MKKMLSGCRTGILSFVMCLFFAALFAGQASAAVSHTVRAKDSLWGIAALYGTTVDRLRITNNISGDSIFPGQQLQVPEGGSGMYNVQPGDSLYTIAERHKTTVKRLKADNRLKGDTIYPGQKLFLNATAPATASRGMSPRSVSRGGGTENISGSEFDVLARIITAEADNQSYETKVAVGAVVLNRVKSTLFPDTIRGVVYQVDAGGRYQFEPVLNGWINRPASESAKKAAKEALSGTDPTGGALFFWESWVQSGYLNSRPQAKTMGAFTFTY